MAELKNHIHVTLNELERNLTGFKIEDYIQLCENAFDKKVSDIAHSVLKNPNCKAIFISGPTASGKTTFTHKLASILKTNSVNSVILSLDDYYYARKYKSDIYGRPDFESLEILDTDLMVEQIKQLMHGKEVLIPTFDFIKKERDHAKAKATKLPDNGILLVEGLHGLSDTISGMIKKDEWFGVFIMPYATLVEDYNLLDRRDIRILRRIARDALHRGACALATIDYWPMLDSAEEQHFPDYLKNADFYINSIIPYEFYCVAPLAHKLMVQAINDLESGKKIDSNLTLHRGLAQQDLAVKEAKRLIEATKKIPSIHLSLVPETSLLKEFTQ